MSSIADEIIACYGCAQSLEEDELMHIGVKRRSGRYPYGSGETPYQHGRDFLGRVDELKKSGFTFTDSDGKTWTGDNAIAKSMGLTSSEYRRQISWANYERRLLDVQTAKRLQEKEGLGPTAIGKKMGLPESTVRSLLNPKSEDRMHQTMETVNFLRDQLEKKGMIDVGTGVEKELNISKERLDTALDYLQKAEGCPVYKGGIPQVTNKGQQTNQRVLCLPGTEHKEIYEFDRVKTINDYITRDGGQSYEKKFYYPESMNSKRLMVRYKEDGGIDKDGIVELRPGVADLSLGNSRYSQVRILVDGTHYIKGMAVYADPKKMPDGVDVIFNTNKGKDKSKLEVLKEIKSDPDNPFGSAIKDADQGGQYWYDPKTGERVSAGKKGAKLGLINKRADEGDWDDWKDALPSQFLGKQSRTMAKKQLGLAKADKVAEFEEICSLTNPTVKKHLLEKFADTCDSAAVHLQAAALPGQKYHVIIPINTLKDTEVYAPNYENGTKLALIRYPHGGTFEIPILTVNNKNSLGKDIIGTTSIDAVGINHKIADRLSGADFDGDTVMCIPTHDKAGKVKIASTPPLKGLEGFDPKMEYCTTKVKDADGTERYYRNGQEIKVMKNTGTEMGKISNLITDMTLAGASQDKLARAVRHSMVVIDAEKHKLDYKASEIDNNIAALRKEYQPKYDDDGNYVRSGGAATILSRAKGETSVDRRQGTYKVNMKGTDHYDPSKPEGAKLWKTADDLYYPDWTLDKATGIRTVRTTDGKKISYDVKDKAATEKYAPIKRVGDDGTVTYTNKAGDITYRMKKKMQESTKMAEADDAYSLVSSSKHPMELIYADYANSMKDLANKARLELKNTGKIAYSATAKTEYQKEVDDLMEKLKQAELNTTKERQAQRLANVEVAAKRKANPNMKPSDEKKARQQAITKYRTEVGSVTRRKRNIDITDREWEAIQKGAISENNLKKILNNTDIDVLRERATPRTTKSLSTAQVNRAKAMASSNYTLEQIAAKLGVSTSTVSNYLKKKGA